jgi:hypothetical protein
MVSVTPVDSDDMLSVEEPPEGETPSGSGKKAPKKAPRASAPKEPVDPNAPPPNAVEKYEGVWVDSEGYGLKKDGERDQRWRNSDGSLRPLKGRVTTPKGEARKPGVTRHMKMEELLAPRDASHPDGERTWTYVRQGYTNEPIHSATGAQLKKFFVIRNDQTGEELTIGEGEMKVYAKMSPPLKPRGAAKKSSGTEDGFAAEGLDGEDEDGEISDEDFLPDNTE